MGKRTLVFFVIIVMVLSPLLSLWGGHEGPSRMALEDTIEPVTGPMPEVEYLFEGIGEHFIENRGQLEDGGIMFYTAGDPLSVGLYPGGVGFLLKSPGGDTHRYDMVFADCNAVEPVGHHPLTHRNNHFLGNDPDRWVRGIRTFAEVTYEDAWNGIDLRFYFQDGLFKYDVIVEPGGDPATVAFTYLGITGLQVDPSSGDLLILTPAGTVRDACPVMFQPMAGATAPIRGGYRLVDERTCGFRIDDRTDPHRPLVIDPGIEFGSYVGGSGDNDLIVKALTDDENGLYIIGETESTDLFTTAGSFCQTFAGGIRDMFVMKFDLTSSDLVFSTYIGGSDREDLQGSTMMDDGSILIWGDTYSDDFPTTENALNRTYSNMDIVILKLESDGSDLSYSSYFGGNGLDMIHGVQIDGNGRLLLFGETRSSDLPATAGTLDQTFNGFVDTFVARLDATWGQVQMLTYIGGSNRDYPGVMVLDHEGNMYIVGYTQSIDLPTTTGAFMEDPASSSGAEYDVFALKLDPTGSSLDYCTYLGGSGLDTIKPGAYHQLDPVRLMMDGSLLIAGETESSNFPVNDDAFCQTAPSPDHENLFISRLDPTGSNLTGSTFLGGDLTDRRPVLHDTGDGRIAVVVDTLSQNIPTTNDALKTHYSGVQSELFLAILDDGLTTMEYGTYLGGVDGEVHNDVMSIDDLITIVGSTLSNDYPVTPGCFDDTNRGQQDLFITTFNTTSLRLEYSTLIGGAQADVMNSLHMTEDGSFIIFGQTQSTDLPLSYNYYDDTFAGGNFDAFVLKVDTRKADLVAPNDLRAEAGLGTVTLTWKTPWSLRTIGFNVYWGLTTDEMEIIGWTPNGSLSYTHTSPSNGTVNYYRVSMKWMDEEGPLSDIATARPVGIPTVPLGLVATTGDGSVHLDWTQPNGTGGGEYLKYKVLRGDTRDTMFHLDNTDVVGYNDTTVEEGRFYYYAVQAFNEMGSSPATPAVRIRCLDTPSQPAGFKVTPGNARVDLSWNLPVRDGGTMLVGFHVWRMERGGEMEVIATLDPSHLSFRDTNVTNGRTYTYMVSAFTDVGEGTPTAAVDTVPLTVPSDVTGFTATPGDGAITLDWNPPETDGGSKITGYSLYWGTESVDLDQTHLLGNVTTFTHSGITNGLTHYYQIAPENEAGLGPVSGVVHAKPMGPPGPVRDISVEVVMAGVRLTWAVPSDSGGVDSLTYQVLRGTDDDPKDVVAELTDAFEHLDDTVVAGTTYYYRVVAVNPTGEGPSGTAIQVTAATPPGTVSNLVISTGNGRVDLEWSAPQDGGSTITEYVVLRGIFENSLTELARVNALNITDMDVENGKTYYYRVFAVNTVGGGQHSDVVSARPLGPPGAPGVLTAKAKGNSISLTWAAPSAGNTAEVTGYKVYRGPSEHELELLVELGTVTSYEDKDVKKGTAYHYKVVATSESGDSDMSRLAKGKVEKEEEPGFEAVLVIMALLSIVALGRARRVGRVG